MQVEKSFKDKLENEYRALFEKYGNTPLKKIPTKDLLDMIQFQIMKVSKYDFVSMLAANAVFAELKRRFEKKGD